jgi:KDO2-lipid IV(A) lauroyltransferase
VGGERLAEIARDHRAAVLISGHFSNWEIMAAAIVHLGVDCQITYRAANNPGIDRRIIEGRRRYGVKLLAPKGGDGSREILDAMKAGQSVAFLNDQKFNGGVTAPFFGRPTQTAPGPARMALRFDAPIIPMSVQRTRGARFRVVVHPPLEFLRTGDRQEAIRAGVEAVNAFRKRASVSVRPSGSGCTSAGPRPNTPRASGCPRCPGQARRRRHRGACVVEQGPKSSSCSVTFAVFALLQQLPPSLGRPADIRGVLVSG